MHDPRSDPRLQLETACRIDQFCERFEEAVRGNCSPEIETFLAELEGTELDRQALLRELLAIEIEYRLRRGERPTALEYTQRFSKDATVVDLVFRESKDGLPQAIPEFLANHPRYRVERWLASGGMGSIYFAEHRVLQRPVALKVINPDLLADASAIDRFAREARTAARLGHPNVVLVYDAETAGGGHFLVMEYVAGTDLARMVAKSGPLPIELACDYVRQAAAGLQHAHDHGMVHRDITPRNLMLTEQGQVKILDFGLAYFVSETGAAERLEPARLLGTMDFMAPEQAADSHAADIRADIYGLGCTLYFLLAGQPPFPGSSLREKLRAHAEDAPLPIRDLRDDVPQELAEVLDRMLAKLPADRFQMPRQVAAALAPFAGPPATGAEGEMPARGGLRGIFRTRRRRRLAALAGALMCGGIAATVWWIRWQSLPGRHDPAPIAIPDEVPEPHPLYREAQVLLAQRQEAQTRLAIQNLKEAIRAETAFAPAYAALADAYNLQGDYGWKMADDVFPQAKEAARKAVKLDDHIADAHLALARAVEAHDCDWKQAEMEYRRALELSPKLAAAHYEYAWFLVQQGRNKEADAQIEQAERRGQDQLIIANNVGRLHYFCRRYELAVSKLRYVLKLSPDFRKAHRDLGFVYAEMGRVQDSLDEFDKAKGLTDDGRDLDSARAYAYARNGRSEAAHELLHQIEPIAKRKPLAYEIATIYAALGEKKKAFIWLDQAFREHSAARSAISVDPRLDGLRKDDRFAEFLKEAGLAIPAPAEKPAKTAAPK